MFPGMNPKKLQGMMKKMGMSQKDISAKRVIIEKQDNSKIIIDNPSVVKVDLAGQETFQVSGKITESGESKANSEDPEKAEEQKEIIEESSKFEKDVEMIAEKTNKDKEEVAITLEKNNGDIAETILELSK